MARTKGSKNKGTRKKAGTPYETYKKWYKTYTKGNKAGWFMPMYNEKEFNEQYELAKKAKISNPARSVAMSQEYVDRKFERQYKKMYGQELPDITDKKAREAIFVNFVREQQARGMDYDDARDEFEQYFY